VNPDDVTVHRQLDPARIGDLVELFRSAWWARTRDPAEVARAVAGSDLVVALVHEPDDRLVGFARVLTDFTYLATILDVIVAPDGRGAGLGARLMDTLVGDPDLAAVRSVELVCQPDLLPFYRQWGFTDQVGRSTLMRRTTDAGLIG
jgi:GNAT superfamily N-acetyltransferase